MHRIVLLISASLVAHAAYAQVTMPSAPSVRIVPAQVALAQASPSAPVPAAGAPSLTRAQAEAMALRNNPRITVSHLLSLAQGQVVRETRAAELPLVNGAITGEEANDGSRFGYGSLSSTRLINHVGGGIIFSQLLTDFGRTHNLVASSKLQVEAQRSDELATRDQVLLVADQAFYNVLQTQAMLRVAQQAISTRQTVQTEIHVLARNNLRSTLDASFADVNVSEAQLLLLDAQSNVAAAAATLDEALGLDHAQDFTLVDDAGAPPPPPPDLDVLTQMALKGRPDLQALAATGNAQRKLSRAQAEQKLPTLTALGTVGGDPVRSGRYFISSWDGGVAGNLSIPIFNGFLYSAQSRETALRAQATEAQALARRNSIVRDVHSAWLTANNTFGRINVSAQLLTQANGALALAQTRYNLGLASIAELSQAELAQTQANIGFTNAGYAYRAALAALQFQIAQQP